MRNFCLVLSLFFCFSSSIFSQSKLELAKELLDVQEKSDTTISDKKITEMMKPLYKMQIEMQVISKDSLTKKKIDAAVEEIMKLAEKQKEETKKASPEIYAKYYTEQELKELIQLYKSSIWKKQQEMSKKISAELIQISSQNNLKIQELIQKKAQEINNKE